MHPDKGKQMWLELNNIIIVTDNINKKRAKADISYGEVSKGAILNQNKSIDHNFSALSSVLVKQDLRKMFMYILADMYEYHFWKASSVDASLVIGAHIITNYDSLKKVNLLEHSFGVFNQMHKLDIKKYGVFTDFFLLAALTHDFGKSVELRTKYGLSEKDPHHKNSSYYLIEKLKEEEFAITLSGANLQTYYAVADAIRLHHDKAKPIASLDSDEEESLDKFRDLVLKFLKEADHAQRNLELEEIRKNEEAIK